MKRTIFLAASPIVLALTACGGGSTGQVAVNSTPSPTPTPPPPTPTPSPPPVIEPVTIVPASADVDFAVSRPSPVPPMSMRYDNTSGQYLITLPAYGLSDDPVEDNPNRPVDPATGFQQLSGNTILWKFGSNTATDLDYKFDYSSLLVAQGWNDPLVAWAEDAYAVGLATPAANMPISGSASFSGIYSGTTSATYYAAWCDEAASIAGTIDMQVDFASGAINGQLSSAPSANTLNHQIEIPNVSFGAALTSGTNGYAGTFSTALSGDNWIAGLFTGPGAEETIGSFIFPFTIPSGYIQPEGTVGSAYGSYIAKR